MWRISAMLLFLNASMLCGQRNPAAVMGMRIKAASQRGGMIAVITTGAKFELDAQGNIHCWQRIPRGLPAEYTPAQLEGAGAYPSNGLIRAAAKHCKVYTLHAYIWQDAPEDVKERMTPILHTESYIGHPQPWLTPKHIPLNMQEFIRVRDEVHKYGMKLVVYLSPIYSTAPDILSEMQRVLEEYRVD